jgi:hypothetical protein
VSPSSESTEVVFKEKRGVWDPMLHGADYDLTLSHSRLWSQAFHPNDDQCRRLFSQLEQPIGKEKVREGGMEGMEADFMSKNGHCMEHGQPHLIPLHGWL